jgi:hypothetical protein
LIDRSGDVGHHPRPKHFGFPLDVHPSESEIVDAVFQPEKPIRGEPVESCKLRFFNSVEFFDHTGKITSQFVQRRNLDRLKEFLFRVKGGRKYGDLEWKDKDELAEIMRCMVQAEERDEASKAA